MANTGVVDLDAGVMVEKRGHDLPCGSKNKSKGVSTTISSSSVRVKRCPGHPLGSENKPKPFASLANEPLDATTARRNTPPPSSGNIFSFFAFAGAQCREQQRMPLKFTKFMDGQELREAILREESGEGSPYEVEVYYNGDGEMFFRGGWPHFAEDYDLHQGWFLLFNYHYGTAKVDVKIFDGMQCQKKYKAELHFH
jgi:hypothetical protein